MNPYYFNKMLKLKTTLVLVCLGFSSIVFGQKYDRSNLLKIASEQSQLAQERQARILKYLQNHSEESKTFEGANGEVIALYDVINGEPQYITTYNEQARLTTGVDFVQSVEGLNIPMFGEGLTIGVWDGGLVLHDHQEFGGRVFNKLGSEVSNHATHVTGTIAAAGVDPKAKGMLPEVKIHSYYAFEDDLGPMATEAANGLILSNHSYGLVLGWRFNPSSGGWNWLGGADDRDETFGAYTANSRAIDNITFNAPYYTIVWSAGNDRSDVGDGTRPPDGPFDIIGPAAGSKNIITVGAITGFEEYFDPESAVMSTFSSWGPTNDGRIKPDVVADGVGVYSAASSSTTGYTSLQGTSMSAPNATGTFGLIQQYYRSIADTFMTAAELKSLVIHTTREAGQHPGPDYKFGWGVVNAIDAIKTLQGLNTNDTVLVSKTLATGDTHEYEIFSDGITPVTATLVWTDVPGTVREETSTLPNLVNDLDIKLVDDLGNEVFPWTLDPANVGKAAVKANNIVDNVEKIELLLPKARKYRLIVSHKGNLANSEQVYALTYSFNSAKTSQDLAYWVNGSGDITADNNFSLSSGGAVEPLSHTNVQTLVIDENSFTDQGVINLGSDLIMENIVFTSDDSVTLDLNGFTLEVSSPLYLDNEKLIIRNGTLVLNNAVSQALNLNFTGTDNLTIQLDQVSGTATLNSNINVDQFVLNSGSLSVDGLELDMNTFTITAGAELEIANSTIHLNGSFDINGNLSASSNQWVLHNTTLNGVNDVQLDDNVEITGASYLNVPLNVSSLYNQGVFNLTSTLVIDTLSLSSGSILNVEGLDSIVVQNKMIFDQASEELIQINGDELNSSNLLYNFREKICIDNVSITNINFKSGSVLNVGAGSTVNNSTHIFQIACEDLLFADFDLDQFCSNSLIQLSDLSEGNVESYSWEIADTDHVLNGLETASPVIWFDNPGEYTIALTISNELQSETFTKTFEITSNELTANKIIENDQGLVSTVFSDTYLWYYNGQLLEGAESRILEFPIETGIYNVVYFKEGECGNRVSEPYELTTITSNTEAFEIQPVIYPNPFNDKFTIENLELNDEVLLLDAAGRILYQEKASNKSTEIQLKSFKNQLIILQINRQNQIFYKKLIQSK